MVAGSPGQDDDAPQANTCRICMESQSAAEDPLISPCLCKGSTRVSTEAAVHPARDPTPASTPAHHHILLSSGVMFAVSARLGPFGASDDP